MKKLLFLAYAYPPANRSGTFRTFHFANLLARKKNYKIHVLTLNENSYEKETLKDNELLKQIDQKISIHRTRCFHLRDSILKLRSQKISDIRNEKTGSNLKNNSLMKFWKNFKDILTEEILAFPDRRMGWIPFAVKKGLQICKREKIDVIVASGGPWSAFVIGSILKKLSGVPLILDFRDPWTDNPFNDPGRSQLYKKISKAAEHFLVNYSNAVILNTDSLKMIFKNRFTGYESFFAVHNGYLQNELQAISGAKRDNKEGEFLFVYAGTIYGHRSVDNFLLAFKKAVDDNIFSSLSPKVVFVGIENFTFIDSIQKLIGLEFFSKHIIIHPRLPHSECLEALYQADCLLLFQQGTVMQVPRKLFEYIAIKKPIFAVLTNMGETAGIIKKCNAGLSVKDEFPDIYQAINELVSKYAQYLLEIKKDKNFSSFEMGKLADKFEDIIDRVSLDK